MMRSTSDVLMPTLKAWGAVQPPPEARGPDWTEEALEELEEVPAFLRGRARRLAEERARAIGSREVTTEILEDSRL